MIKTELKTILYCTTVPETLFYAYEENIPFLKQRGFDIIAITSPGTWITAKNVTDKYGIPVYTAGFTRTLSLFSDILVLMRLCLLFLKIKPAILHASTPKASLLALFAGWITRVPTRIYTIRGIASEASSGSYKRWVLAAEKISCLLAHRVFAVSKSNLKHIIRQKICAAEKISILGNGSSHGVNATDKYNPDLIDQQQLNTLRNQLGIPGNATVFGFIGRIVKDKGVEDLVAAWKLFCSDADDVYLLLAGPITEPRDRVSEECLSYITSDKSVRLVQEVKEAVYYYALMDIFVLPSCREGFPNVVLEAGAMRLPVITTRALGCVDSVIEDVTGMTYLPGDTATLLAKMKMLYHDTSLRKALGYAAREHVLRNYNPQIICDALLHEYQHALANRKRTNA